MMRISGSEPIFLVGVEAVREEHGPGPAAPVGGRLTGFALVRFVEDRDWFSDCPVVLHFDGIQAEICHWKFDELSIGWDTIDTTAAISGWGHLEPTPAWSDAHERLEPFVGRQLPRGRPVCVAAIITS
ncbi:hypothetical protein AB0C28_54800 [Nonomuraea sp. NPDC048892]|uniref:hypothetical protein n=1 Tax=Nonomuraea sp. NPDC048892 TaxID=3154624 RepID=UPI0033FC9F83